MDQQSEDPAAWGPSPAAPQVRDGCIPSLHVSLPMRKASGHNYSWPGHLIWYLHNLSEILYVIVCEECEVLFRCKVLFLLLFIRPFHSLGFLQISIRLGLHCAFSEAILGWQKEQKNGMDGWYRGCY